ncbi:homeobox protein 3-like [Bicyclus anynana]|uniref:Homeobox protein 3-like n=1 Tax=Bicyclus anynana TaxID=110368 RepID=A0ABM3LWV4_BICAN|nr:homeobox protein 3-like [Bicyclus anynana]
MNPKASNAQLQHKLANILNPEQPTEFQALSRTNKNNNEHKFSLNNIQEPTHEIINNSDNKFDEWDTNDSDLLVIERKLKKPSNTHFHSENVITSYDKNKTIETIKKELVFESLLIKNNNNNFSISEAPTNVMNPLLSPGNNAGAVIHSDNPFLLQMETPNRRYATNANSVQTDPFQIHIQNENNVESPQLEPTDYGYYPNTENRDVTAPLRQNNYVIDKHACEDKEISDEILDKSGYEIQLQDPTKGVGISNVGKSRVMLMDHPRVCYACSSINDPSCWSPDRRTAVKYCRTDHRSCVTKYYKYKGLSYIIRDCGNTCQQNAAAAGPTKYTTCTICHHDLCNSAYRLNIQYFTMFLIFTFHLLFYIKRCC